MQILGLLINRIKEDFSLGHFYDGPQVHFGIGRRRATILVADQPDRNPESINLFFDLYHFLLFALKHFERILHLRGLNWGRAEPRSTSPLLSQLYASHEANGTSRKYTPEFLNILSVPSDMDVLLE